MNVIARGTVLAGLLALAACSSAPPLPPAPASLTSATPQQMVAAVRAAATAGENELAVQPLRDARTGDLREQATRFEQQGRHAEAAAALDQALAITPEDPVLLQERAEAAMLLRDFGAAEALARKAHALGSGVGPLCRRHWATIEQARLVAGDGAGATAARATLVACKVDGPTRY